jgi:hypothetical protein
MKRELSEGSGGKTAEASRRICVCVCVFVCVYIYIFIYLFIYTYFHNFGEIIMDYDCMSAHHILRLTDTRMSKLVYEYFPTVRRDVGRPKLR